MILIIVATVSKRHAPSSHANTQLTPDRRLQRHKYDIRKRNRNNPRVKHISVQDDPVNINNATTVKIMNNVRQRKVIGVSCVLAQIGGTCLSETVATIIVKTILS